MKGGETEEVKKLVFTGICQVDDVIDSYSKHTLLHDAVIMNREDLFEFLLQQGANPMVRDANGQTPLLKAAALGRIDMARKLVLEAKVDPRHVDPYGVSPREKAELYLRQEMVDFLHDAESKATRGEIIFKEHDCFQRGNRFRTIFDY